MLDCQRKTLVKIISAVLIIAFLMYDIAWATDFSSTSQRKDYASRSLFKNKKVDHDAIKAENEANLNNIKDVLSHKKNTNTKDSIYPKEFSNSLKASYINDIANIYIPDTLGKVVDSYSSPDSRATIINIQDLHTNPEASFNMANILEILIKGYNLNLVCSEGASGEVDTSSVSSFPDPSVREKVAKVFVNSGELTGEEYLSITKYPDLPIWGIEDKDIYIQHIAEFNKIMKFSPDVLTFISKVKDALDKLKPKIYSKELLELDTKEIEYEESKIETKAYLDYLLRSRPGLDISNYQNIAVFIGSLEAEKTIDQQKIIQDSQNLLTSLQSVLKDKDNKFEIESLLTKAALYKDKGISPFSFYSYLDELAMRHLKEDIDKYPDLFNYISYLRKINSLDSSRLFNEIEELAYEIKDLMSDNDNQKLLTKTLRNISFLESFFNLKISNEGLQYYLKDKESFKVSFFKDLLEPNLAKYNIESFIDFNPDLIDKNLPDLENFYELAHKRDIAMFNNATSEIETRKPKLTALITGGFHTQGITKLLKENNYSYVVISPYSKTTIDEENYRNLLQGKRKPIKELMDELNEKLRAPMGFGKESFGAEVTDRVIASMTLQTIADGLRQGLDLDEIIKKLFNANFKKQLKAPIKIRLDPSTRVIYVSYGNIYMSLNIAGVIADSNEQEFKAAIKEVAVIRAKEGIKLADEQQQPVQLSLWDVASNTAQPQLQRLVSIDKENNVALQLKDGKTLMLGNIQRPNFIFNQKIVRWAYVQRILDLTVDRWLMSANKARSFYEYVQESDEYVRKDIGNKSHWLIANMYRRNKPYVTGIKKIEAMIESWCERNAVELPGNWAENKNKKKEQRAAYLVAQVKSWFAVALQEDDPRLLYKLFNARVDITDFPFWNLPIFPVTEKGEIDAELIDWMIKMARPPKEYLTAKKVSLEDLTIGSFITSTNDAEKKESAQILKAFIEARLGSFRKYFKATNAASENIREIDHITIAVNDGIHDIAKRFAIEVQEETDQGVFVIRTAYGIEIIQPIKDHPRSQELVSFLEKRENSAAVYYVALGTREIEKTLAFINQTMLSALIIDKTPGINAVGDKIAFIHPEATQSRTLVALIEHKNSKPSFANFSLLSKDNSLTKGDVNNQFKIGETIYTIGESEISNIGRLGESVNILNQQNGQNITFTIRGPTISKELQEYLAKTLPEALTRSASLHKGTLKDNITIILTDKYDYIAGDHRQNNIIILNASDLEKMIKDGVKSAFISELIISILSEELAHERGADGEQVTEEALARTCANNTITSLGAIQIEQYSAFIEQYGQDLEDQRGYPSYLKVIGHMAANLEELIDQDLEYGLKTGVISEKDYFYSEWHNIFIENGIKQNTAQRLSQTLAKMKEGSLEILYRSGVINQKEKDILLSKDLKGLNTLSAAEKKDFARRFKVLADSYDASLTKQQKGSFMLRLVPLDIIAQLSERYNCSRTVVIRAIIRHPDFPVWMKKAHAKASEIKNNVGGITNAWTIVLNHGIESTDSWVQQAQIKVDTINKIPGIGGLGKAWFIVTAQGLENVDDWIKKAQLKVDAIKDIVGGVSRAWEIVVAQGIPNVDIWLRGAEKKVSAIKDIVGGPTNAWGIVTKHKLAEVDDWVKEAKVIVDRIKDVVGGEREAWSKAWSIVMMQGLTDADEWVNRAQLKVDSIRSIVGGYAWTIVISQGIDDVDSWIAEAKPKVDNIAAAYMVDSGTAWQIVVSHGLDKVDSWIKEAKLKVNGIEKVVGAHSLAWKIVVNQGINNADKWTKDAAIKVMSMEDIVGGATNAWQIVIAQGLDKADVWTKDAELKVKSIKETVGASSLAWEIVIAQGLNSVDAWMERAKIKADAISTQVVGGQYNVWAILIRHGIDKVDAWLREAHRKIDEIKETAGSESNAWNIVMNQGVDNAKDWTDKASVKVAAIKDAVGGSRNAWFIVIKQGIDGADDWIRSAEIRISELLAKNIPTATAWHMLINSRIDSNPTDNFPLLLSANETHIESKKAAAYVTQARNTGLLNGGYPGNLVPEELTIETIDSIVKSRHFREFRSEFRQAHGIPWLVFIDEKMAVLIDFIVVFYQKDPGFSIERTKSLILEYLKTSNYLVSSQKKKFLAEVEQNKTYWDSVWQNAYSFVSPVRKPILPAPETLVYVQQGQFYEENIMPGSKDETQSALLRRLKIIRDYASGLSSDCEAGGYYEYGEERVNLVWNIEASTRSVEAQYTIFNPQPRRFHTHPSLDAGPSSMDIFSYNIDRFQEQDLIIEGKRAIAINNPWVTNRKNRAFLFLEWRTAVDRFTALLLQLQEAKKSNRDINDSTFSLIRREFIKRYLDSMIKEFSGSIGVTNYNDSFNDEATWIKVLTHLFGLEVELIPYGEDGQPLKGAVYPPQLIKGTREHFLKFFEGGTEAIRETAEQTLKRFGLLTDDTIAFLEQKAGTKLQTEKTDINKYPADQEKYKHIFVYLGEDMLQNVERYRQEITRIAKDNRVVIIAKDEAEAVRLKEQRFTDNIVDILIADSEHLKDYDIIKIRNNVSGVALPNEFAQFGVRLDAISKLDPELAKAVLSGV